MGFGFCYPYRDNYPVSKFVFRNKAGTAYINSIESTLYGDGTNNYSPIEVSINNDPDNTEIKIKPAKGNGCWVISIY